MPELPDLVVYVEHLARRLGGARLECLRVRSPNLLRTADPAPESAHGRAVLGVTRSGKRIVVTLEGDFHLAIHLMISGRFRWTASPSDPPAIPARVGLAAFDFSSGTLLLTEASTHQRAGLWVLRGAAAVRVLDAGGIEPLESSRDAFAGALGREDHTLKRSLTDPRLFSGIGNAYSDEILHRARLSPLRRTSQLSGDEIARLHDATRQVLLEWTDRLRREAGERFPERVTAFRDGMAVHGRYRRPCPECGARVQRIVYADRETNYCARCQTGGRLLADRALSRLLRTDWPKTLEELEG